jgi:large subunit ribosomal protein L1
VADLTKDYPLSEAVDILPNSQRRSSTRPSSYPSASAWTPPRATRTSAGTTPLPNGSGKKVRVLVFTDNPEAALDAGADHAGLQDLMAKINEGWLDFDVAIATTEAMKQVRTLARVLGPKGLMPNPKSGTVTDDIAGGIKAVKAGRVEFKMDKAANIGVGVGKRSFTAAQILENACRPSSTPWARPSPTFKGSQYIKMWPSHRQHEPVRSPRVGGIFKILRSPTMRAEKQYLISEVETHLKKSPTTSSWPTSRRSRLRTSPSSVRKRLAAEKAEFHVVKNSSLRVAAKALGLPEFESGLTGPTAIVVGGKNSAGVAKILKKFFDEKQKLEVKVGVMDQEDHYRWRTRARSRTCPPFEAYCARSSSACSQSNAAAFVRVLDAKVKKEPRLLRPPDTNILNITNFSPAPSSRGFPKSNGAG